MLKTLKWILVPVAAVLGLAVSVPLAGPLNRLVVPTLSTQGHTSAGYDALVYALRFDGAMAAALFILSGYIAAPSHRLLVACTLFVIGTVLAWRLIGDLHSLTFLGTLTGGAITLVLLFLYGVARPHLTSRSS
jgi:hypothetical protein